MNGTENGPFGNGTEAGSGAPSKSIPVLTATVVPVPEASDVADASKPAEAFSKPADINQGNAGSTPVADATAPAAGGAGSCSTVTSVATSIQYVTVTAGDAAFSPPAGFEAPESSVTLSSKVASVSAGEFYGGGGGRGGWGSSSAAVATTMATSYGGAASSAAWGSPVSSAAGVSSAASSEAWGNPVSSAAGVSSAASSEAWGNPVSSAAGTTPSTIPSVPGSGAKKGLSYNTASLLNAFDGTGMSWAYNWADTASGSMPSGVEYVPMCWGLKSVPACASNAQGASHVLSFNEPDLGAQSNMDPQTAAENHIKYLNPLGDSGSKVSSPAITNGAGTSPLMGIDWLNEFFKACNGGCKVDMVAFHWYDSSSNYQYFESHVNDVIKAAADNGVSKVWLTEFGTTDGNNPDFISKAVSFLDSTAAVERYAYFMVDNILEQGGSLSSAGKAYAA